MKRLVDWLVYALVRTFVFILAVLPRPLALRICWAIAGLFFWCDARHRRIGLINLRIAFPDKGENWRRTILLRSFRQLGDHLVEIARLGRLSPNDLRARVRYEEGRGLENYLEARSDERGVIFLTAHISVWELLPAAHASHGYPLSFVVRPLDNPFLDRWANELRSRFGNRVIPKRQAMRQVLKTLRDNGDVGFLNDQNSQRKEGLFVPLFGRDACTNSAVAALALKTGCPVVAGFIYPSGRSDHYQIRFYPPLIFDRGADQSDRLQDAVAAMNRYIEEVIREFPECWLWGHRRFRTQPPAVHNPYDSPSHM